jgi:hypothetical protein
MGVQDFTNPFKVQLNRNHEQVILPACNNPKGCRNRRPRGGNPPFVVAYRERDAIGRFLQPESVADCAIGDASFGKTRGRSIADRYERQRPAQTPFLGRKHRRSLSRFALRLQHATLQPWRPTASHRAFYAIIADRSRASSHQNNR